MRGGVTTLLGKPYALFEQIKTKLSEMQDDIHVEKIISSSIAENGYIKYSSGLIINYGSFISTTNAALRQTIYFGNSYNITPTVISSKGRPNTSSWAPSGYPNVNNDITLSSFELANNDNQNPMKYC